MLHVLYPPHIICVLFLTLSKYIFIRANISCNNFEKYPIVALLVVYASLVNHYLRKLKKYQSESYRNWNWKLIYSLTAYMKVDVFFWITWKNTDACYNLKEAGCTCWGNKVSKWAVTVMFMIWMVLVKAQPVDYWNYLPGWASRLVTVGEPVGSSFGSISIRSWSSTPLVLCYTRHLGNL